MALFHSFLWLGRIPLYIYIYHIFFIHPAVDEHLGCFHVSTIVHSAAMNIEVHVSFWISVFFFCFFLIFIFIYLLFIFGCVGSSFLWGLSLVAANGGHSSSRCTGLLLSWPLLLQSTGSRCTGSVVVAHGPSCSMACGIFPDQGSNPCPLH